MLNILGAGYAYPQNHIDNDFVCALSPQLSLEWIEQYSGISKRGTILPPEFIKATGSTDPWISKDKILESPTDLSYVAVQQALNRAGIVADQLGLIIGECCTPFETTPSEGQRVGNRLGVKIPAYDVCNCCGSFPLHINILNAWSEDRTPDYVLCVSSNTPTQRVDYSRGVESAFFGDAAAAVVLSAKHPGKLAVRDSLYLPAAHGPDLIELDLYGVARIRVKDLLEELGPQLETILNMLADKNKVQVSDATFIGTQICMPLLQQIAQTFSITEKNHWYNVNERGFTLGSGQMCVLAERWDDIEAGQRIVVATSGGSLGSGYVLLES